MSDWPRPPGLYLPEPAALQEGQAAAQQLQGRVPSVEDLQERHQGGAEDGEEQQVVHVDVQRAPAVEVEEEQEPCRSTTAIRTGSSCGL